MQLSISKKKQQYKQTIRQQNLHRIMGLKRIRPKLIECDQDASVILKDGIQIIKNSNDEFERISALKSIKLCFTKYQFKNYDKTLLQLKNQLTWLSKQPIISQIQKQAIIQVLSLMCFRFSSLIQFQDLPINLLNQFNLRIIKLILTCLCHLLFNINSENRKKFNYLFNQANIYRCLLQVKINFYDKKECFEVIKIHYIICAVSLSYINSKWGMISQQRTQQDFTAVLGFATTQLENDIISSAEQDVSLKKFFQKNYLKQINLDSICEDQIEYGYPFSMFKIQLQIFKEVNVDVSSKLQQCLIFQIKNQCIQQILLTSLIKCFWQTTSSFCQSELKQLVFAYIFQAENSKNEQNFVRVNLCHYIFLQEFIILAINDLLNSQIPDQSIYKYTGDCHQEDFPNTIHFLEVMDALEEIQDYVTQQKLLELVENYVIINGSTDILDECKGELARYKEGVKFLKRVFYDVQALEQFDQQGNRIMDQEELAEIMEIENDDY